MSTEPNFITIGSQTVAHYSLGSGPPLVILHGWGSSARVMMPLASQLSSIRTCHLIDLPGFGSSPEPATAWSVGDYANLVNDFIDGIDSSTVDLLVHSYGGRIALKLLADPMRSTRIGKVLITGGAGMKPKRKPGYYLRRSIAGLLKAPARLLPGPIADLYTRQLRGTRAWRRLGSTDYAKLSGVMRETFVKSVSEHLDELLPHIRHEVLLVWGEQDEATPLYQGKRMESGLNRASLVVIDGSGHYAFLDRPKQFAAIAAAYLRESP